LLLPHCHSPRCHTHHAGQDGTGFNIDDAVDPGTVRGKAQVLHLAEVLARPGDLPAFEAASRAGFALDSDSARRRTMFWWMHEYDNFRFKFTSGEAGMGPLPCTGPEQSAPRWAAASPPAASPPAHGLLIRGQSSWFYRKCLLPVPVACMPEKLHVTGTCAPVSQQPCGLLASVRVRSMTQSLADCGATLPAPSPGPCCLPCR
jgi:hypothetical protein